MAFRNILLLLGTLPGLFATATSALADTAATASYVINLAGANIASVDVNLSDDGRHYTLGLKADITGLAQLVATGTAKIDSEGLLGNGKLASQKFGLLTHAGGEDFSVKVEYASGDVTAFIVDPPLINNVDRVAVERKHLHGVNDMLASFILRAPRLDRSLCDRKIQIFTGLERFDLAMRYTSDDTATSKRTGYQGPVVLCNIRYKPVSGHFTTSDVTNYLAASDHILIWYAPLGETGYFIPYRVLIGTAVGDLSMVLTAMSD